MYWESHWRWLYAGRNSCGGGGGEPNVDVRKLADVKKCMCTHKEERSMDRVRIM
jgi:hypothetical protein